MNYLFFLKNCQKRSKWRTRVSESFLSVTLHLNSPSHSFFISDFPVALCVCVVLTAWLLIQAEASTHCWWKRDLVKNKWRWNKQGLGEMKQWDGQIRILLECKCPLCFSFVRGKTKTGQSQRFTRGWNVRWSPTWFLHRCSFLLHTRINELSSAELCWILP